MGLWTGFHIQFQPALQSAYCCIYLLLPRGVTFRNWPSTVWQTVAHPGLILPWQDLILSLSLSLCKIKYNPSLKTKFKQRSPCLNSLNLSSFRLHTYLVMLTLSSTTTNQMPEAAAGSQSNIWSLINSNSLSCFPSPKIQILRLKNLSPQNQNLIYIHSLVNETSDSCLPPRGRVRSVTLWVLMPRLLEEPAVS